MSLPRRTPPSQMISMRSPTASATGATRSMIAGAESSWRPPWFDERDGVDPLVGGDAGVGDGLDALDHDRTVPDRAQPLGVAPREAGIHLAGDVVGEGDRGGTVTDVFAGDVREADRLAAHELPRPARVDGAVEQRVETDLGRQLEAAAHVAFAPAVHREVDGEHQGFVARGGGPLHHLLDEATIAEHVELEPLAAVACLGDLLDRTGARACSACTGDRPGRRRGRPRARRRDRRCG